MNDALIILQLDIRLTMQQTSTHYMCHANFCYLCGILFDASALDCRSIKKQNVRTNVAITI